jgi:hypothetical protein
MYMVIHTDQQTQILNKGCSLCTVTNAVRWCSVFRLAMLLYSHAATPYLELAHAAAVAACASLLQLKAVLRTCCRKRMQTRILWQQAAGPNHQLASNATALKSCNKSLASCCNHGQQGCSTGRQ